MAHEVELKFTVAPKAMQRLAQGGWLKTIADVAPKREKVVSVYYDTPKSSLRYQGISLRVRRAGGKHLQTVKGNGAGEPFSRDEWEDEIEDEKLDLSLAKKTPLKPLLNKKLKRSLKPVFETRVERISVPVTTADSLVEIALDRGQIKTGDRRAAISEIELELKRGDPFGLVDFAKRLLRELPLRYEPKSKAERGYALADREAVSAVCADEIVLDRKASTAEAFTTLGLSCLRHLSLNEGAILEADAEGIHQMRVGLRRLRAAMSIFKDLLQGPETEQLKKDLRWLAAQLGPARDLDVFVKEGVVPLEAAQPRKKTLTPLKEFLEKKRSAGFKQAKDALDGERYRRIIIRTALWLSGGKWLRGDDDLQRARRDRPIGGFAGEVLSQRTRKIVKRINKLENLSALRRHKLRIAIKKLRYATEFFMSLFPGRRTSANRKVFAKTLKRLQSALGKLNDIKVHENLADTVVHARTAGGKTKAERAFAMGVVTGHEQADFDALTAQAMETGNRLSKLPRFWK